MDLSGTSLTEYEPTLTLQCLRGCAICHTKHPLAFDPPLQQDTCPNCGNPVQPPEAPQTVPAEFVGRPSLSALLSAFRVFNRSDRRA